MAAVLTGAAVSPSGAPNGHDFHRKTPAVKFKDRTFRRSADRTVRGGRLAGRRVQGRGHARRLARAAHVNADTGLYGTAAGLLRTVGETTISENTREADYAGVQGAPSGADRLHHGATSVFALCRPPGHYAAFGMYSSFCFINNAAVAAGQRRNAYRDPRCGLSPWQWHPGYRLAARRRFVCVPARRPDGGISTLSGSCRRDRHGQRRRVYRQ